MEHVTRIFLKSKIFLPIDIIRTTDGFLNAALGTTLHVRRKIIWSSREQEQIVLWIQLVSFYSLKLSAKYCKQNSRRPKIPHSGSS